MHACLHGITKKLMSLWFDTENNKKPYYIGRPSQVKIVDERLLGLRVPSSFRRRPRSVKDQSFYKASEELFWLFHYSAICLENILPNEFLQHFQLFATAVFTLNKSSFSQIEKDDAERCLQQFAS